MGLFTDRCIDPECNHRVRKGSQFCPRCGAAAPKGLTRCGGCQAEVRASSKFCWRCGAELSKMAKPFVFGDRWARRPEDFAVRIDDQDVKGWLAKPLIVEHGTRAMLFQAGRYKGELSSGRYDTGGFLKRLNHFMVDLAASVVLTDAGDVTIDLENGGLRTAEGFEVGTIERLVLRVRDPEAMFVNLFKGRNRVGLGDLEEQLAGEVQMLLSGIVSAEPAETLFTDVTARNTIEQRLRETLAVTFQRLGLELVQLRFISFVGEAYEELRRRRGELALGEGKADLAERRGKLNQRLRETITQDKMDAFKSGKDLESFIRQTEHELGLKDVIRDDEMQRLTQRFQLERDRESLLRRIEIEGLASDERREQAWKELLADERERDERHRHELQRQLDSTVNEAEKRKILLEIEKLEHAEDVRQGEEGLRLLKQTKDIEHEEAIRRQQLEAETLAARSKATAEALLSIVDGPAAERIARLENLRRQQSLSPEQMLALAAQASPEAAKALAAKYGIKQLEDHLAEQRRTSDAYADRMERLMQTALSQMGDVAGARCRPAEPKQTVVVPGGMGSPVVVAPGGAAATCRHCRVSLESSAGFCPQCGKKQ